MLGTELREISDTVDPTGLHKAMLATLATQCNQIFPNEI